MRYMMLIALVALVGACSELSGPTVVRYEVPSPFYVRHIPWVTSQGEADAQAGSICENVGGKPEFVSSEQYYAFDTRYSTYRCVGTQPADITAKPS